LPHDYPEYSANLDEVVDMAALGKAICSVALLAKMRSNDAEFSSKFRNNRDKPGKPT